MHEFSIASSLVELVAQHVPPGGVLRSVTVEAGPLQGIDQEAMRWAWQGVTAGGRWEGSTIEVLFLPWRMLCPDCGKEHVREEMLSECDCGGNACHPVGGGQLLLKTLTIDDDAGPGAQENAQQE